MAQIANRFNVKYCTIHNILSKHKINRKSDPRRRIIDKDLWYLDKNNLKVVCEKCYYTIYHPYTNYNVNQKPSCTDTEGSETIPQGSTSQAYGDGSALHPEMDDDIVRSI